ncbi:hypothetical protein SETIT_8G096100v2 [Setaria italica]|uniref:Uncharacterized protein n=1 Tax=Setaria italica TaxID=4555 RepID=A0A368S5Z7_SETIT|nr:hypothetical protein SETIT_8G096100v2 [Setaria italica]
MSLSTTLPGISPPTQQMWNQSTQREAEPRERREGGGAAVLQHTRRWRRWGRCGRDDPAALNGPLVPHRCVAARMHTPREELLLQWRGYKFAAKARRWSPLQRPAAPVAACSPE